MTQSIPYIVLYGRIILQDTDLKTSQVLKYSAREGWKKISYTDCVKNEGSFHRVKEERNILHKF